MRFVALLIFIPFLFASCAQRQLPDFVKNLNLISIEKAGSEPVAVSYSASLKAPSTCYVLNQEPERMTGFDRAGNPLTVLTYRMAELTGTVCYKAKSKTIVSGREELPIAHSGLYVRILSPNEKLWHGELVVPTDLLKYLDFYSKCIFLRKSECSIAEQPSLVRFL